jgi:hypothetical protein
MADTKDGAASTTATGTTTDTGTTDAAKTAADAAAAATATTTTAADGKKDDGKASTDTGSKAADAKAEAKAPEKYELTVPEGGAQYIAADDLAFIEEVARANDWTNDEAQAEINASVERATARETAQAAKLLSELKADKDYGGEKLADTQRLATAAINKVFPVGHRLREGFLQQFNRGVVQNNLLYLAFLAEIGRQMGEDSPAHSQSTSGRSGQDLASKLYDHPDSVKLRERAS